MLEQAFGLILTISFSSAYIPQIIKIIKRKSSNDVSLIMLIVNGIGYSSGLAYVLLKNVTAYWLLFNYSAGLLMTIFCTIVWAFYRK
tara:strand:- start:378 stop:638 length:261 start_codon:yes stop_codon:yes gene_type:complete